MNRHQEKAKLTDERPKEEGRDNTKMFACKPTLTSALLKISPAVAVRSNTVLL